MYTDRRNEDYVYEDGSSELAVFLSAPEAQEVATNAGFDATAIATFVAAWYSLGFLEGGQLSDSEQSSDLKDEAGTLVRTTTTDEERLIDNVALQTDDFTAHLLKWLKKNTVKARYPLPVLEPLKKQWRFFPRLKARSLGPLPTSQGARKQPFQLVATKALDGSGPELGPFTLPNDQTNAAWLAHAAFKDVPT